MEEVAHVIEVLTRSRYALEQEDTKQLRELSDRTIHAASVYQHTDYILVATIIYALSKLVERKDKLNLKNWQSFIKDVSNLLSLAINSLQKGKHSQFIKFLSKTKYYLENSSQEVKPLIEELLRKASINKASKIYEHGISLAKTTKLLGVTPWELSEYIGEKEGPQIKLNKTIDVKDRIKLAMEFFQ
jgi:predicted HTH domain antitoxin